MLTKSILTATLTATAIALVAGLGSASAADEFTTLDGVAAEVMSATELSAVVGSGIVIVIDCPRLGFKPSSSRRNCFSTKANRAMMTSLE